MSREVTEVVQLKQSLETSLRNDAVSELFDILTALKSLPMTFDILQSTKIGIAVNEVKKKSPESDRSYGLAKDLLKRWKKIYEKETSKTDEQVEKKTIKLEKKPPVPVGNKEKESKKEETEEDEEVSRLPTGRKTAYDLFKAHLMLSANNENVAGALAFHIEHSINNMLSYDDDPKGYTAKVRSLAFNLKKNERLRVDIVDGVLAPQNLVHLTPNELATDAQRAEREQSAKNDIAGRRTDYYQINRTKIMEANGLDANAGGEYTCRKCGGKKTTHYALQTRSSDEPMTVFVTCLTCGKRWRTV